MSGTPMVELDEVVKSYVERGTTRRILDRVSTTIAAGELIAPRRKRGAPR